MIGDQPCFERSGIRDLSVCTRNHVTCTWLARPCCTGPQLHSTVRYHCQLLLDCISTAVQPQPCLLIQHLSPHSIPRSCLAAKATYRYVTSFTVPLHLAATEHPHSLPHAAEYCRTRPLTTSPVLIQCCSGTTSVCCVAAAIQPQPNLQPNRTCDSATDLQPPSKHLRAALCTAGHCISHTGGATRPSPQP